MLGKTSYVYDLGWARIRMFMTLVGEDFVYLWLKLGKTSYVYDFGWARLHVYEFGWGRLCMCMTYWARLRNSLTLSGLPTQTTEIIMQYFKLYIYLFFYEQSIILNFLMNF